MEYELRVARIWYHTCPENSREFGNYHLFSFLLVCYTFESKRSNRRLPQMEESKAKKTGGKKEGQRYKSLPVWDILPKKTDENRVKCCL